MITSIITALVALVVGFLSGVSFVLLKKTINRLRRIPAKDIPKDNYVLIDGHPHVDCPRCKKKRFCRWCGKCRACGAQRKKVKR